MAGQHDAARAGRPRRAPAPGAVGALRSRAPTARRAPPSRLGPRRTRGCRRAGRRSTPGPRRAGRRRRRPPRTGRRRRDAARRSACIRNSCDLRSPALRSASTSPVPICSRRASSRRTASPGQVHREGGVGLDLRASERLRGGRHDHSSLPDFPVVPDISPDDPAGSPASRASSSSAGLLIPPDEAAALDREAAGWPELALSDGGAVRLELRLSVPDVDLGELLLPASDGVAGGMGPRRAAGPPRRRGRADRRPGGRGGRRRTRLGSDHGRAATRAPGRRRPATLAGRARRRADRPRLGPGRRRADRPPAVLCRPGAAARAARPRRRCRRGASRRRASRRPMPSTTRVSPRSAPASPSSATRVRTGPTGCC